MADEVRWSTSVGSTRLDVVDVGTQLAVVIEEGGRLTEVVLSPSSVMQLRAVTGDWILTHSRTLRESGG